MTSDYRFQLHLICGHKHPAINGYIEKVENYIGENLYCIKCNDLQRVIRLIVLDNKYTGHMWSNRKNG